MIERFRTSFQHTYHPNIIEFIEKERRQVAEETRQREETERLTREYKEKDRAKDIIRGRERIKENLRREKLAAESAKAYRKEKLKNEPTEWGVWFFVFLLFGLILGGLVWFKSLNL